MTFVFVNLFSEIEVKGSLQIVVEIVGCWWVISANDELRGGRCTSKSKDISWFDEGACCSDCVCIAGLCLRGEKKGKGNWRFVRHVEKTLLPRAEGVTRILGSGIDGKIDVLNCEGAGAILSRLATS